MLQDDQQMMDFYKEHKDLHSNGMILETSMSLYSQSQKSLASGGH